MKKTVLVFAAVLVMAALVSAATTFDFGVKAGGSFFKNDWSDNDGSEKNLIRATIGAFALANITPMIGIQAEINYLTTGIWWDDDGFKVTEAYGYLHIPVLVRARLMREGTFVPVVFAGPAVGILLSATWDGDEDVKDSFKSTDFGADLGVGAEIALGNMKLLVDLRYYLGLTDVYVSTAFSMKNRGFMLTAGFLF
jgi:hypothetical protein